MANFLFTWELGGGLGHVTLIRPFAEALLARGHQVLCAVQNVSAARKAFGDANIPFVPAPCKTGKRQRGIRCPRSYAHLLHNNGFADADELTALIAAWRNLFDLFQPDVILCNHSPTALLAARGARAQRVLLGDAFCSPPATVPLPILRPWAKHDHQRLLKDEQIVCEAANKALANLKLPRLSRLADLYGDVAESFLLTFAELDHFGARKNVRYRGVFNTCAATQPRWPDGTGPKVFAYLKPMPGLEALLTLLGESSCRTLAHGSWAQDLLRSGKTFRNVRIEPQPVNLEAAAAECDLAVLNATHGATAAFLLAGKSILQLPIVVEQYLTARNTQALGAGLLARRNRNEEIRARLEKVLGEQAFTTAAQRFAQQYSTFDPTDERQAMVERMEQLLQP